MKEESSVLAEKAQKHQRLMSLDTLRGLDMLLICGLPALIAAIVGGVCGHQDAWIIATMKHAGWIGFNVMDTVFPLFMFMSGIAFPYSYAKRVDNGATNAAIVKKLLSRMLILVALGLLYGNFLGNVFSKGLAGVRYPSVLARIGIAWAVAAALYVFCGRKTRIAVAFGVLVGYWALCAFVPVPGAPAGSDGFASGVAAWPGYIDKLLLPNHHPDPEGVLSSLPAIVTTMGGVFTGELVRSQRFSGNVKTLIMLGAAAVCGLLAWAWSPWCPIIKKIWTSSFVLAAWSYSLAWFAVVYWLVDVMMWRKWTFFFRVIGVNSILVYLMKRIIDFGGPSRFLFGGFAKWLGAPWEGVVMAAGYIVVVWLVLLLFYRKGVFLKV